MSCDSHSSRAIFLDRDGVVNENRDDYVKAWEEVRFFPGVFEALARLAATPFHIVITTNQSPIGRGILTRAQVEAINRRLVAEIEARGGRVEGVYYCPHRPDEGCDCRKPRPGLLLQAAQELDIDLGRSYLVGDAVSDVEAALAVGVQPVMVRTGRGAAQERPLKHRWPQVPVVADLGEAVEWILRDAGRKMQGVKALILAAGEGTRLRPLTLDRPKPMLSIAGQPLLEHTIEWLKAHGITEIAINLHHQPRAIVEHVGDGSCFGVQVTYSHEDTILGTAGAARRLESFFDDTLVVVYGDVLTDLGLTALVSFHRIKRAAVTVALYRVENPSACGLVGLDEDWRITRFVEKPPPEDVFTDLANAGVLVLEPPVLAHIPPDTFYDFGHHLLPDLLARGLPLYGYPISDTTYLIDIGTPEKYERAQREWPAVLRSGTSASISQPKRKN